MANKKTYNLISIIILIFVASFTLGCGGGGGGGGSTNPVAPITDDTVVRVNAVTANDLDHFANEYETYIHSLMLNSYGPVHDIDNDGKVSILISPVYAKLGFAGLFNSNDFADNVNSNQRDLIGIFSPDTSRSWYGERWREASRETICHEMQHLVNYSAHFYFNNVNQMEEEWLDESLSVGSEARYRLLRGSPLLENRFSLWADSPSSVGLINFSRTLSQYGMVGLFNLFLYDQSNDATIKAMVNATLLGKANVDNQFAAKGGMDAMFRKWAMASLIDALRSKNQVDISKISNDYKYSMNIGLDLNYTNVNFGYTTVLNNLPPYGAGFYILNRPAGFSANDYQFKIKVSSTQTASDKKVDIVMVNLPGLSSTNIKPFRSAVVGGTSVLANPGEFFNYTHTYSADSVSSEFSINIPAGASAARFALVVANPNDKSQSVQLVPESHSFGNVVSNFSSARAQFVDDYGQLILNQSILKSRLRARAQQTLAQNLLKSSRMIRASDHSGEKVGDIVMLKVVADWWGNNYVTRRCKLERVTANCKIFVDQDPYDGLSAVPVDN